VDTVKHNYMIVESVESIMCLSRVDTIVYLSC